MTYLLPALFLILLLALLGIHFGYTLLAIVQGAPFIPSNHARVKRVLDLAAIIPGEKLLDLGSGDGRIVFAAAKRGAICVGIEINPLLFWYSSLRLRSKGLLTVTIKRANFWTFDISDVDVLTVYLVPLHMDRLKAKILKEMKTGSRVISVVYQFPDWIPEKSDGDVFLYRAP
jgi:SAM-dependent methyltransferase